MASGLAPVFIVLTAFRVFKSNTVTCSICHCGEAATEIGCQRYAMHTLGTGNVSDDRAGIGIQHNHVSSARNIDATCVRIHNQIIPAILTRRRNGFGEMVCRGSGTRTGALRDVPYGPIRADKGWFRLKPTGGTRELKAFIVEE